MRRPWSAIPSGPARIVGAFALVVLCWTAVVPPGAGADEPGHLVRAGAVVRGEWSGVDVGSASLEAHVLPDSYTVPDTCYAFRSEVPVDCAPPVVRTGADVEFSTRADEYQVWPHLLYGLPTLLPGFAAVWWARLVGAIVVTALVGAAFVTTPSPAGRVGILAALTPMAFGTFATVNPSALTIAGAVGVWAAVAHRPRWSNAQAWLFAGGWAAMVLSRRDGLVWAVLIVVIARLAGRWSTPARWRSLGRGPRTVLVASTLATTVWGLVGEGGVSQWVTVAPAGVLAAELARRWWDRTTGRGRRAVLAGAGVVVGAAVVTAALSRRPGGWDTDLARRVVGRTGVHLVEAVGVLGWLDTPMPWLVVVGWVAVVGVLAGAALDGPTDRGWPAPVVAAVVLAAAIGSAWVLELLHGNTSGQYWQGRYSLPLLVGIPVLLTAVPLHDRVRRIVGITVVVLLDVAIVAAARRWGVGTDGSLRPWDWNTPHTPLPTLVPLAAHAVASAVLVGALLAPSAPALDAVGVDHVRRGT